MLASQAWLLLFCGRVLVNGQILPEVVACNGFAREWGVCPDLPACFQPVHCKFAEWEDWYYGGGCAGICYRRRQVQEYSDEYGKACNGPMETTKDCTTDPSYVSNCYNGADQGFLFGESQCTWQVWSDWSDCSRHCGGGEKSRDRHIAKSPKYGGAPCVPGPTDEVKPCSTQPCMSCVDGKWAEWQPWQACSVTCGSGLQWRQRDYAVQANQCGRPATGSRREFKPCHGVFTEDDPTCTVSVSHERCMLGDWENWGACQAQCDIGRRARRRPYMMDNVRHYTQDLEDQVFKLQSGNEQIEQKQDFLVFEQNRLQRKITMLQSELAAAEKHANEGSARQDKLQSNVTKEDWQRKQLEMTIARLKEEKANMVAQVEQLAPDQVGMPPGPGPGPGLGPGPGPPGPGMTLVALAAFILGAAFSCVCFALQKKRHRMARLSDDAPDTASVASEVANMKDVEQPWRHVSSASDGEGHGRDGFE